MRILLVEDSGSLRALVEKALVSLGHTVVAAADGQQACDQMAQLTLDALVSDILMPEQDGLKVIKEFRRRHPRAPVIAMSGGGDLVSSSTCLTLAQGFGATALLQKPFSMDELLNTVMGCATAQASKDRRSLALTPG